VICALPIEAEAVESCFDARWNIQYTKATRDQNAYTVGRMGKHAVVLAWMPGTGKANSASVAANCHSTFTGLKLCLIVGVCGGVPTSNEPLLGDVVISTQVVQYDYGSRLPNKVAIKNTLEESLPRPNREIRSYLGKMSSPKGRKGLEETTTNYLQEILNQEDMGDCKYPGVDKDRLFGPTYRHKHYRGDCCICTRCENEGDEVCDDALKSNCVDLGCKPGEQLLRPRLQGIQQRREGPKPRIHFGPVASGDLVMKSAQHRDQLAFEENVIAFEMESAGAWETLPTIVIKSICDYADSHKGYEWHGYAAAAAAACMKAFLGGWWPTEAQPGAYLYGLDACISHLTDWNTASAS
jgi:nucleoside phosphorylase